MNVKSVLKTFPARCILTAVAAAVLCFCFSVCCGDNTPASQDGAGEALESVPDALPSTPVKITAYGPGNFYRVSENLYRSEQPSKKEFAELEKNGIKSVLNLRDHHSDRKSAEGLAVTLYEINTNASDFTRAELLQAVRVLYKAKKPVLVHCWHGSDRTGVVIAASRIVFEEWTVEQAVREFTQGPFGFHRNYTNLPKLLRSIDWDQFKQEVKAD